MRPTLPIALLLVVAGCATTTPSAPVPPAAAQASASRPCVPGDTIAGAVLWVRTAAEYRASAIQAYTGATRALVSGLADPSWTAMPGQKLSPAMPPAVILDLDETALDNSEFEVRTIRQGKTYSAELWTRWVDEANAGVVPGAAEFLSLARARGVTPFYVTNRDPHEKAGTRANLEKLGFPLSATEETLLLRGERPEWKSDKSSRRDWVASRYRVLAVIGDDLNDFAFATGKSLAERDAIVSSTQGLWGTRWFILPNPMYGSWERSALANAAGANDCEKKVNALSK